MRIARIVAGVVGGVVLALGAIGPLALAPASATPAAGDAEGRARCARLAERVAQVPAIQERIAAQIDHLERRHELARHGRRDRLAARLAARLEKLEELDANIAAQAGRAREACAIIV